jgi:hypothetical protein
MRTCFKGSIRKSRSDQSPKICCDSSGKSVLGSGSYSSEPPRESEFFVCLSLYCLPSYLCVTHYPQIWSAMSHENPPSVYMNCNVTLATLDLLLYKTIM